MIHVEDCIIERKIFGQRHADALQVALGFDDNYLGPAQVVSFSVAFHTKASHLIWITTSHSENIRAAACHLVSTTGCSVEVLRIDLSPLTSGELKTYSTISPAAYNRLLLPYIFDGKVLYIDSDVINTIDLRIALQWELMNNEYPIFVQEDLISAKERRQTLSLPDTHTYFNSGVMLINCRRWKEKITLGDIMSIYERTKHLLLYADQCLLNVVFKDTHLGFLPKTVNILQLDYGRIGLKKFEGMSGLFHFNARPKPWELDGEPWSRRLFDRYRQLGRIATPMPSSASFDAAFVIEAYIADGTESEGLRVLQAYLRKQQQKA